MTTECNSDYRSNEDVEYLAKHHIAMKEIALIFEEPLKQMYIEFNITTHVYAKTKHNLFLEPVSI
jgi:hypothetical protein